MKVVLFGATGMVGQGVLHQCLLDPDVKVVTSILRSATTQRHEKLKEIVHQDFLDFSGIESEMSGLDTCFFCLGVASSGMSEESYQRVTYGFTMAAAETLIKLNRGVTFIFVSGQGTDSSEHGRLMWARVKGKTENALLRLPFKGAYMFRPGFIQPQHGIKSRTRLYRAIYSLLGPIMPMLKAIFPKSITTTDQLGRAMLKVAKSGFPKRVLGSEDINSL